MTERRGFDTFEGACRFATKRSNESGVLEVNITTKRRINGKSEKWFRIASFQRGQVQYRDPEYA